MIEFTHLKTHLLDLARDLDFMPLSSTIRERAVHATKLLDETALPQNVDENLVRSLDDELFFLTHRAAWKSGPLRETARRLRGLIEIMAEGINTDCSPNEEAPVLTPWEAAQYLGLDKLGIKNPEARVHYLVKQKKLRSTLILGRRAFQRSDLDRYLVKHAAKDSKKHA